ncbi:MAG: alpha/beta fold hydrolase, partial [Actinomycetota bacterium]
MRKQVPIVRLIGVVALLLAASVVAISPADAREVTSEDLAKTIRWEACHEDAGPNFECGTIRVPLDYDRPFGSTVELALVRLPAANPESRMGSILLNPGGPGGSGVDFALGFGPFVGQAYGQEVADKFDIVGFDPRGINRSSPVRCFSNLNRAFAAFPPLAFPLIADDIPLFEAANRELARSCRRRAQARRVGSHASTANVAKDMDVIRASLGDEYMNFLGLSYGTYIGAVYVNTFPERVRAVVVDGVLDPIAWVNEEAEIPFSTRLRSDKGAQDTLNEFFRQCDAAAPGACALAPNSAERYAAVADALLGGAVPTDPVTGEPIPILYQDLIGLTLGNLYNPFGYPFLAFLIADLESLLAGSADSADGLEASMNAARAALMVPRYENVVEGFPAVACTDTSNPKSYEAYEAAGIAADAEFGYFGRLWTWASVPCISWPFVDRDRYEGPFDAETANPVLVVGNFYDPATRYEGAQTLRSLLPNS